MMVTFTNLSATAPIFVSQLQCQLAPSASITERRTLAQLDADSALKTNIANGLISVTLAAETGDSVADSAIVGTGICTMQVVHVPIVAGISGAAQDYPVFVANAPFAFLIMDVMAMVSTSHSGGGLQLRSATGGGGSAQSDALVATATGVLRNAAATASVAVAAGGTVYVHSLNNLVAGEVNITILRTA